MGSLICTVNLQVATYRIVLLPSNQRRLLTGLNMGLQKLPEPDYVDYVTWVVVPKSFGNHEKKNS